MNKRNISLTLYIVGSLLVFGSWAGLVPTGIGWLGWLAALIGWGLTNFNSQQRPIAAKQVVQPSKAEELEKLAILRKEDFISEEEFQKEKERILHQSDPMETRLRM